MKKESKLYCRLDCSIVDYVTFTNGKYYNSNYSGFDSIQIECNEGHLVSFYYPETFNKYFITVKELRRNKLEKLKVHKI